MWSRLLKAMNGSSYSYGSLATELDCSSGVLSKFIKDNEVIDFDIALNVVRILIPDNEKDFMFTYCELVDKPKNIKSALEYASVHTNGELLVRLLDKHSNYNNKEVKEFVSYYQLLADRINGTKDYESIYTEIAEKTPCSKELQVLKIIMEMHFYYQNKAFTRIEELKGVFEQSIDKIKSEFIRNSYTIRLNQMKAYILLHIHSDVDEARKLSLQSIEYNLGCNANGFFYNILATSYFNESIKKMNHFADKSVYEYKNAHNASEDVVEGIKNRFDKLNMILSKQLDRDFVKDDNDPLDLFIEGKLEDDTYKIIACLVELTKRGNIFFTEFVVQELRARNCNEILIQAIQTIK